MGEKLYPLGYRFSVSYSINDLVVGQMGISMLHAKLRFQNKRSAGFAYYIQPMILEMILTVPLITLMNGPPFPVYPIHWASALYHDLHIGYASKQHKH